MAACCGDKHTITLSNDGTLHSFGKNAQGQLGLGHSNPIVLLPTPIPNLPKISMISCGFNFTVCVDCEGFMWSFGDNIVGQLGTGNTTNFNVPQKIQDIPPVLSVSCGTHHTLIITTDSNLWSCGSNNYGQLCLGLGVKRSRSKPQKTSFSNITKISAGVYHSLFQNNKGEIFACGYNLFGECGLGHYNHPQITPSLIPNVPSNIVHFVCGSYQNLFLDSEGNVFSVGYNNAPGIGQNLFLDSAGNVFSVGTNTYGQLGLGHNTNPKQNVLNKIVNIPPIQTISCVNSSCYLIDCEGNLWSFGSNDYGQLGNVDKSTKISVPKLSTLKDIQQISHGSSGRHFIAKNSQNQIFVTGFNDSGQLGTGDTISVSTPKEINSQYSTIWRDEFRTRAKSARK